MSAPLPAEAGFEIWERIVLLLVLFRNNSNKSSEVHLKLRQVLPF